MKKQTIVLIVSNRSLLGDILEDLLGGNDNLLVHRATPGLYRKMLRYVEWPDSLVAVVEKESLENNPSQMMRDAGKCGRLQIIVVSSESDDVIVFANGSAHPTNHLRLTSTAGLVTLINVVASQSTEPRNWFTAVTPPSLRLTTLP
ncbi:MAG TPA: hypothetical protein PLD25_19600 [Chloroflexota bacterium]|nr:hypothetical protein [Chloroflexota bacterium]HUM69996.1 hypothetical protein [Chloroflexota bacterium]